MPVSAVTLFVSRSTLDLIQYYYVILTVCVNGDLRLVGGSNDMEGRVEMCLNQQWGTVCDNGWDATDAGVACRQLGFSEHSKYTLI